MQCCTCYNWVHLKCSLLSFSRFKTVGRSHFWSFPPCCVPACFWRFHTYQHCDFLLGILQLLYLHCSIWLIWPRSANAALASHPLILFQTSYPFTAHFISSPSETLTTASCSWLFLFTSCFFFPSLTPSEFLNRMQGVSEPGAVNCYTLFRLTQLTFFVYRNLTLIYLPLSGSPEPLLCDLIAATPCLIFFLLMSQTLAVASSFSSGRAYPSPRFLPPLFLRLTPTLIMWRSTSLYKTPPCYHFLMFMVPLFALLRRITEPIFFSLHSSLAQNLGSNHLPILLTVPLFPVFRPNERLPSFNFQRACWNDFAFYFDSHCPSAEEYSFLFLSFAAAFFTSLTLNALLTIWCSGQMALFLSIWQRRLWRTCQLLSLCGTEATLFFSAGPVCSSFSVKT